MSDPRCACGARICEPARCTNGHAQRASASVAMAMMAKLLEEFSKVSDGLGDLRTELAQPGEPETPTRLVDAKTLANMLGKSRRFVYDHRDELGAVRLTSGERPRLLFDPERVIHAQDRAGSDGGEQRKAA